MNPLRRIEQEVLVAGQEWTRLELQRRLQEQCDGMAMELAMEPALGAYDIDQSH